MNHILFRDTLLNMLLGLTAVTIIALPMINPPAVADQGKQPGNMVVSIAWPEGSTDIDLWVKAPGDKIAVGYANRAGRVFNLLRDDIGTGLDELPLNYENAYSRGLPAGEYTVNVHYYRGGVPIPVAVEVRMGKQGQPAGLVFSDTVTLQAQGQERTAISFTVDADGKIVAQNKVYKPLRVLPKKG